MPDLKNFDLDFRPQTYFVFADAKQQIAARVKGTARRSIAARLQEIGELGDDIRLDVMSTRSSLDDDERTAWGAIHPSNMGGEYLPDLEGTEVEIARIELNSTTSDVISVRAMWRDGECRYSVVDEYPDDHSYQCDPTTSNRPLTMGEVIALIDTTRADDYYTGIVVGLLQFNYECSEDLEAHRDFVSVSSAFYPELGSWYDDVIEEWYEANLSKLGRSAEGEEMTWLF